MEVSGRIVPHLHQFVSLFYRLHRSVGYCTYMTCRCGIDSFRRVSEPWDSRNNFYT